MHYVDGPIHGLLFFLQPFLFQVGLATRRTYLAKPDDSFRNGVRRIMEDERPSPLTSLMGGLPLPIRLSRLGKNGLAVADRSKILTVNF